MWAGAPYKKKKNDNNELIGRIWEVAVLAYFTVLA
jgi:hypothetical protein